MSKYGINKAILLGTIGTDPDLRFTQNGHAVCSFRLATTERRPSSGGNWVDSTTWHTITLWRQKAELAKKMLSVGSVVYLEGRIVNRNYEGKDGQKRTSSEVEVEKIRFLGGGTATNNEKAEGGDSSLESSSVDPTDQKSNQADPEENDLPF